MAKYPGLAAAAKAKGIAYMTAYQRLEHGWSFLDAVNTPVRKRVSALLTREDREEIRRKWKLRLVKPTAHTGRQAEPDTAPPRIRKIRAAFCEEFIKTGVINVELQNQLRAYANECRAANQTTQRVPADPAAVGHHGQSAGHGDNRLRDADQTGRATAELVYDYLRAG